MVKKYGSFCLYALWPTVSYFHSITRDMNKDRKYRTFFLNNNEIKQVQRKRRIISTSGGSGNIINHITDDQVKDS